MSAYPFVYSALTNPPSRIGRQTRVREKAESPNYGRGAGEGRGIERYYTKWGTDPNVIRQAGMDFLGYSEVARHNNINYVRRITPYMHPNFAYDLYADKLEVEPDKVPHANKVDEVGTGCYDEALLTVGFSSRLYTILEDTDLQQLSDGGGLGFPDESSLLRYCTISFDPRTRREEIPNFGSFRWLGTNTPVSQKKSIVIPEGELTVQWEEVPLSFAGTCVSFAILSIVGTINATDFGHPLSIFGVWPAGTLLCEMPKIRVMGRMSNGELSAQVLYKFSVNPNTWNKSYRWDTGAYQEITSNGQANGRRLFRTGNFNRLFSFF